METQFVNRREAGEELATKLTASGITQESKSAIKCWCYEQHQHFTNPCHSNVPHWLTLSQYTHELCEFSAALRPYLA